MTKTDKTKKITIAIIVMLLIMLAAFGFRLMSHRQVVSILGEEYTDPDTGVPYLTEMDSYYHLRMTRDIMNYGVPGGQYKDDQPWDSLSYAPYGRSAGDYKPLMAYIAILSNKIISKFKPEVTLEKTVYWQGTVLSVLVVIPVFIFAYRLGGLLAAMVASILASVNYGYFVHTIPGFYDTDTLLSTVSCLFFLSAVLLISTIESSGVNKLIDGKSDAVKNNAGKIKKILSILLYLISLYLLIISWNAYTLFIGIAVAALIIYAIAKRLRNKENLKPALIGGGTVIALIIVLIMIFDIGFFANMFSQVKAIFAGGGGIFPDAYVSVSEMKKPAIIAGGLTGLFQMKVLSGNTIGVINAVGGALPCAAAITMCIMLIRGIIKKDFIFDHVLLVVWSFASFVLAFRNWRFIMLFAVPVALLAGLFVGWLTNLMREKKMMDYQIYVVMIVLLAIFPALYGVYRSSADSHPSVSRSFHEPIKNIRYNAPKDAILASWWDYGYFYEEKADRRTIFDGGSQNGMRVYWIGKALSTQDEVLSKNIIKMLSGEGDAATEKMTAAFGENKETLALMTELLSVEKETATEKLKEKGLSDDESKEIANLMFPQKDEEVLCLITRDMYAISQWFYTFGTWGEDGVNTEDYAMSMTPTQVDLSKGQVAWRFNAYGEAFNLILTEKDGEYEAHTEAVNAGAKVPAIDRVVIRGNGMIKEDPMEKPAEGTKDLIVYLETDSDKPVMTVMTEKLYDSVFGTLYFKNGQGLSCFTPTAYSGGFATVFEVK